MALEIEDLFQEPQKSEAEQFVFDQCASELAEAVEEGASAVTPKPTGHIPCYCPHHPGAQPIVKIEGSIAFLKCGCRRPSHALRKKPAAK